MGFSPKMNFQIRLILEWFIARFAYKWMAWAMKSFFMANLIRTIREAYIAKRTRIRENNIAFPTSLGFLCSMSRSFMAKLITAEFKPQFTHGTGMREINIGLFVRVNTMTYSEMPNLIGTNREAQFTYPTWIWIHNLFNFTSFIIYIYICEWYKMKTMFILI